MLDVLEMVGPCECGSEACGSELGVGEIFGGWIDREDEVSVEVEYGGCFGVELAGYEKHANIWVGRLRENDMSPWAEDLSVSA